MQPPHTVADIGRKAKITISYKRNGEGDVTKTLALPHEDKSQLEALLRSAFRIPESEDIVFLVDGDSVCFPLKYLDVQEASKSKSLVLQTIPKKTNAPNMPDSFALPQIDAEAEANSWQVNKSLKDDKRKNNRGLDQRRSYSKAEKILVMLLKDMGKSAEEIATVSAVSKSNVEKWCADKTREGILEKFRQSCHEPALLEILPPNAIHFNIPSQAHALAAARVLLNQLHQMALSSPLLALENVLWARGNRGATDVANTNGSAHKRTRLESGDSELSVLRAEPSTDKYAAHLLSSLTACQSQTRTSSGHMDGSNGRRAVVKDNDDNDDDDSVEDDVELIRGMAARSRPRQAPIQGTSHQTEDWVMQYTMPLGGSVAMGDLHMSAEMAATRPMLRNTRYLTEQRARLKRKVPTAEEEEDQRILSLLGE